METSDTTKIGDMAIGDATVEGQINDLFGSFRAEWLPKERVFELFRKPNYFPDLESRRPCMLIGGRGTGKTTVLKSLSYEGQYVLHKCDDTTIANWPYYGFYYRLDTNRVTAFEGEEAAEKTWIRIFAHYLNLVMCDLVFDFLCWYESRTGIHVGLRDRDYQTVTHSLHLPPCGGIEDLASAVTLALTDFEAEINNIADGMPKKLSMQGAPVEALMTSLRRTPQFAGKDFFFIFDEYENLHTYQQAIINTLIKHCGSSYTIKVGVKELGLRRKSTLNPEEQLLYPADYERINIAEKLEPRFEDFALDVCNERMRQIAISDRTIIDIRAVLPGLSEDDEAKVLGIDRLISKIRDELQLEHSGVPNGFDSAGAMMIYLIHKWACKEAKPFAEMFASYRKAPEKWEVRLDNYRHALLYTIRRDFHSKGVRGHSKYYAGWKVYTQLSGGNIRFLMQLVVRSLLLHLQNGKTYADPVNYETQTDAAKQIGKDNLSELEGLSVHGGKLTKLLLGLGRIFNVMATHNVGHTPEVSQFHLSDNELTPDAEELLTAAIMHLALVRSTGTKLNYEVDTRDYDYMLHPIFSAFFEFSYRCKRKMLMSQSELLDLIGNNCQTTIRAVLGRHHRGAECPLPGLPEQLRLFEAYYNECD